MTTTSEQQKDIDIFAKYMILLKEKRDIMHRLDELNDEIDDIHVQLSKSKYLNYNEEFEVTLLFNMKDDDDDDDDDNTVNVKKIPTLLKNLFYPRKH